MHAGTGEVIPARVYLFKGGKPFRLSPVESLLPLRPDLFYESGCGEERINQRRSR